MLSYKVARPACIAARTITTSVNGCAAILAGRDGEGDIWQPRGDTSVASAAWGLPPHAVAEYTTPLPSP